MTNCFSRGKSDENVNKFLPPATFENQGLICMDKVARQEIKDALCNFAHYWKLEVKMDEAGCPHDLHTLQFTAHYTLGVIHKKGGGVKSGQGRICGRLLWMAPLMVGEKSKVAEFDNNLLADI